MWKKGEENDREKVYWREWERSGDGRVRALYHTVAYMHIIPLACAIYSTHSCMHAIARHNQSLARETSTVLSSSSLWLKHRDLSLSRSRVGLRFHWGIIWFAVYWRPLTYARL
jgi:hypothetical protein